eukprot:14941327-Alexandrium_andersonii.AAC.1
MERPGAPIDDPLDPRVCVRCRKPFPLGACLTHRSPESAWPRLRAYSCAQCTTQIEGITPE